MTYFIATRDGHRPKLLAFESAARDLAAWGWYVERVLATEMVR